MHDSYLVAETAPKARNGLRSERNLGHEHACRPPRCNDLFDGAEVDLRLSRTRHAVHEDDFAVFMPASFCDGIERGLLARR